MTGNALVGACPKCGRADVGEAGDGWACASCGMTYASLLELVPVVEVGWAQWLFGGWWSVLLIILVWVAVYALLVYA